MTKLTENEIEVLIALRDSGYEWHTPYLIGGHDGSHHSYTLRKLAKKNLVRIACRSMGTRGSNIYALTMEGKNVARKLTRGTK